MFYTCSFLMMDLSESGLNHRYHFIFLYIPVPVDTSFIRALTSISIFFLIIT